MSSRQFPGSKSPHFQNEAKKLEQNLSRKNVLYLHEKKNRVHTNGFALRLALKQRLEVTRKWPITKGMKSQTFFDIGQTGSGKTDRKT